MFSFCPDDQFDKCSPQAYISAELGTRFIECFFEIVHPQIPVLNYEDITASWKSMWQPPRVGCETKKGDEILYMVLALGAHLYHSDGQQDLKLSEGWSEHFHTMANKMACGLADTSLRSTHYMLLKVKSPPNPKPDCDKFLNSWTHLFTDVLFLFSFLVILCLPSHEI